MTDNDQKSDVWEGLSERQIKCISYKISNPTATYAEVAREVGVPENTLYKWRLNQLVASVQADTAQSILDYAKRASLRAVRVLEDQMDSEDENIAHKAAKEMLDRFMGKTKQRQELTGADGKPIEHKHTMLSNMSDDDLDAIINE